MDLELFGASQVQTIVILIVIDVVLGIVAAFLKKDFVLGKVAKFMGNAVVGYVLGFAVLSAVGKALPSLSVLVTIAYVLIVLALAGSILEHLNKLGLPIPKILRK